MRRFSDRKSWWVARAAGLCCAAILVQACSAIPIFSPRVMEGVDEGFEVQAWWEAPNAVVGQKVELGGQIVRGDVRNGETFLVATHLPIVDQLVYESLENDRPVNHYGVHYRATIDPTWLTPGNHFMVVGITSKAKSVVINGTQRTVPFVAAECLHVWKSADTPPVLPLAEAEKFAALEHVTYCTSGY
jgi:starvation-inducible outer membrane lipoprotein